MQNQLVAQPTTETTTTEIAKETVDEARAKSGDANAKSISSKKKLLLKKKLQKLKLKAVSEQEKKLKLVAIKNEVTQKNVEAKANLSYRRRSCFNCVTEIANAD